MKLTLSFLSSCFVTWPKSQDKNLNIMLKYQLFRWNKKKFSLFLKCFELPKIVSDCECAFKAGINYRIHLNASKSLYWKQSKWDQQKISVYIFIEIKFAVFLRLLIENLNQEATISRSSRWQMFFKIRVLDNFAIFTGKHMCWSIFLIKF